jgi:heat shock protein HslJ
MKTVHVVSLFIFVFSMLFISCNSDSAEQTAEQLTDSQFGLISTEWVLISADGQVVTGMDFTAGRPGISFNPDDLSIYGSGGCNRFTGTYTLDEAESLTLSGVAATRMACPELDTETLYFSMIEKVKSFSIDVQSSELILKDEQGEEVLRFAPAEE